MSRGSRPGERRGGRQRGTPNKKTLIKNAVFLAAASEPDRSPLEFMLALMRDPQVPLKDRVVMAEAAAPFVHARPVRRRLDAKQPHPMELRARAAKAAAQTGGVDGATPGRKESPSLQPGVGGVPEKVELVGEGEAVVVRSAGLGPQVTECFEIRPLSPLDFLLAVMADPDAAPRERMRAAQVAARYKHRLADGEDSTGPVEDEFGFKIEPALASRILEIVNYCDSLPRTGEPSPADIQKHKTLLKELREQIAKIECVPTYDWAAFQSDQQNLEEIKKRGNWSANEIAERTYIIARMEAYRVTPRHQVWCRISELEVRRANAEMERGESEFYRALTDTALTDAEMDELTDLRRRFPSVAQQFADRNWFHYVAYEVVTLTVDQWERRQRQFGEVPKNVRKQALFEAKERGKLLRRQMDYLEKLPKPAIVNRLTLERWRESQRQKPVAGVLAAENEKD